MKKSNLYTAEILDYYSKGLSASKIAELLPLCSVSILKVLKENGIAPTKGYSNVKRYPKSKEEEIISLYRKGFDQKSIGEMYHTSNTAIRRVLLRNNIPIRGSSKVQRFCKHNPFKKHDEFSEYFLGLLLTDGCIYKKAGGKAINLSLSETDGYLVEAFRDWSSPKTKVSKTFQRRNSSYMYSVNIMNEEAVLWLERKGNFHRKSFEAKIYVPITWTILRGIFDGDGGYHTVNKNGLQLFICGASKVFILQIVAFLERNGIRAAFRTIPATAKRSHPLHYVEVRYYEDVLKVGIFMYSNASIFMKRKYYKWLAFYESRKNKYTLNSGKDSHSNPEQNLPAREQF